MTKRATAFAIFLAIGGSVALSAASAPVITGIDFTATRHGKVDDHYVATIVGRHFGPAPSSVPCTRCRPNELQVVDMDGAKAPESIDVTSWTNNSISISGVKAWPKQSLVVAVYNDTQGNGDAKGRSPSGHTPGPHIASVSASGAGQSLLITISGSGFGSAPAQVGQNTNSPYMLVTDFNNAATGTGGDAWHAGFCNPRQCDGVTMGYASWSDTQIVLSSFGSEYGQHDWVANPGDAYCVTVWSTAGDGAGDRGATSRCARLP